MDIPLLCGQRLVLIRRRSERYSCRNENAYPENVVPKSMAATKSRVGGPCIKNVHTKIKQVYVLVIFLQKITYVDKLQMP